MDFINELKSRKDLLVDPENLRAVSGASLDTIYRRCLNNSEFQQELLVAQQRKYLAQSNCASRS